MDKNHTYYINDSVVNMREDRTPNSKVVSQVFFFEKIKVLEIRDHFAYVKSEDDYEGWIPISSYTNFQETDKPCVRVSRLTAHLYAIKDIEFGPFKTIPFGSQLPLLEATEDLRWLTIRLPDGNVGYIQRGDVRNQFVINHKRDLSQFSKNFIGIPYTWGGRSSFGFDCSGFVQMLYGQLGINLQRDSHQQIKDERFKEIPIERLETGDLIFFGKSEEKIGHVAMYLENNQFIHASARENQPWVRISHLTDLEWCGLASPYYKYRKFLQLST